MPHILAASGVIAIVITGGKIRQAELPLHRQFNAIPWVFIYLYPFNNSVKFPLIVFEPSDSIVTSHDIELGSSQAVALFSLNNEGAHQRYEAGRKEGLRWNHRVTSWKGNAELGGFPVTDLGPSLQAPLPAIMRSDTKRRRGSRISKQSLNSTFILLDYSELEFHPAATMRVDDKPSCARHPHCDLGPRH